MTALAKHLGGHRFVPAHEPPTSFGCTCGWRSAEGTTRWADRYTAHEAHVDEAWQAHRTLRTVEGLVALPVGSVVREEGGGAWEREGRFWVLAGSDLACGPEAIYLPALIVYHPEEDQ